MNVVCGGAADSEEGFGFAEAFRKGDSFLAGEVIQGEGVLGFRASNLALKGDFTTVFAGLRPHVDKVVGLSHDGFVMFDDHEGISLVAKVVHDLGEAADVAVVESDSGFVEDEESLSEGGAEAGGEVDAGDFAAAQGAGGAVEGEVAESNLREVVKARGDFAEDEIGGFVEGGV